MRASAGRMFAAVSQHLLLQSGALEHARRIPAGFLSSLPDEALSNAALSFFAASIPQPCTSYLGISSSNASSYRTSHRFSGDTSDPDEFDVEIYKPTRNRNVKHMLLDPVSMLVSGRGVPLGFAASNASSDKEEDDLDDSSTDDWTHEDSNDNDLDRTYWQQSRERLDGLHLGDRLLSTAAAHVETDASSLWVSATASAPSAPESSQTGAGGASSGGGADGGADEDDAEALQLFEEDANELKSIQQLKDDLKRLDEVFEALAEVPWLDDCVIQQREQKGMVSVAMLGTLEEAGWKVRKGVHSIWSGERDIQVISQGARPREQAALLSILFHTKSIEEKYGPPATPWKPATDFFHLYEGETVVNQKEPTKK